MFRKPEFVTENHLSFLEKLDAQTRDNLFLIIPKILARYPDLNACQAQQLARYGLYHAQPAFPAMMMV